MADGGMSIVISSSAGLPSAPRTFQIRGGVFRREDEDEDEEEVEDEEAAEAAAADS